MKTFKTILMLLLVVLFQRTIGQTQKDTITAEKSNLFIGKDVVVKGHVVSVFNAKKSKGSPTFLNFEKEYPDNPFTVVIFEDELKKLSINTEPYKDKTITVEGKITTYKDKNKDKPCIKIYSKDQIKIVDTH